MRVLLGLPDMSRCLEAPPAILSQLVNARAGDAVQLGSFGAWEHLGHPNDAPGLQGQIQVGGPMPLEQSF